MTNRWSALLVCLLALIVVSACGGYSTEEKAEVELQDVEAQEAAVELVEIEVSDAVLVPAKVLLAQADKLDGEEDHVVKKCPGCQFHMDGSADNTATVADYELHFCSGSCRDHFVENAEQNLVALAIPEP